MTEYEERRHALDRLLHARGRDILEHVNTKDRDAGYQVGMLLGEIARLFNVNSPDLPPVELRPEPSNFRVQVRSEETGLGDYTTFHAALAAAAKDDTIWKISFPIESGERIRLVRTPTPDGRPLFFYQNVMEGLDIIERDGPYDGAALRKELGGK